MLLLAVATRGLILIEDQLMNGFPDIVQLVWVGPVHLMVDDGLDGAEDLDSHLGHFLGLDLPKANVQEHIEVVDVEKVSRGFSSHDDREGVQTFVEAVTVRTVSQMQKLLSIEGLILYEFVVSMIDDSGSRSLIASIV